MEFDENTPVGDFSLKTAAQLFGNAKPDISATATASPYYELEVSSVAVADSVPSRSTTNDKLLADMRALYEAEIDLLTAEIDLLTAEIDLLTAEIDLLTAEIDFPTTDRNEYKRLYEDCRDKLNAIKAMI